MKIKREKRLQIRLNLLIEEIESIMDMVPCDSDEMAMLRAAHDLLEMFYVREET